MEDRTQIKSSALGIDLASGTEPQLFKWLLASLLYGRTAKPDTAERAFKAIVGAGLSSLTKLAQADWSKLVEVLETAQYVRYDFSMATTLLRTAGSIKDQYGSVKSLLEDCKSTHELEDRLVSIKGVGPATAALFVREVAPLWFETSVPHEYAAAKRAAGILNAHGYDAYIVGGAVRDLWLDRRPKDFDLVTNARPEQIVAIPRFKRSMYKDPAQAFGVTRVRFVHESVSTELEIATYRQDIEAHLGRKSTKIAFAELEDDVLRRDFTINALALDPATNQLIDYVDGVADLEQKIIRFIGIPADRIQEDPLRIMRAIRFRNQLGFEYDPATARAIKQAAQQGKVETIATDRLREELDRLLLHNTRRQAITDLDELGILHRILPEVTAGKGTAQPPEFHSEGDVWQHQLLILDYLPPLPSKRLVWATLLHDIGKPVTLKQAHETGDHIRFDRHYAVGADMAGDIMRRLHFSNRDSKDIQWIIHHHMSIDDLPAMRPSRQQHMLGNPAFEDLLELHRADAAASWRPRARRGAKPKFRDLERLWHAYQTKQPQDRQPSLKRDLGIDGDWLLKHFGDEFHLKSSPLIGKILSELEVWYRDEHIKNKNAYLSKTRQLLRQEMANE